MRNLQVWVAQQVLPHAWVVPGPQQTPLKHCVPGAQAEPVVPQVHKPAVQVSPRLEVAQSGVLPHWQLPLRQERPPAHAEPQAPQLAWSERRSRHVPGAPPQQSEASALLASHAVEDLWLRLPFTKWLLQEQWL